MQKYSILLSILFVLQSVGAWARVADAQTVARMMKPARTAKDFIQLVRDPQQRAHLLDLVKTGKLSQFKRPIVQADVAKNTMTISGKWGKLVFDFKASDKEGLQINGKKYLFKNNYKLDEFTHFHSASLWNYFFMSEVYADDDSGDDTSQGFLASIVHSVSKWISLSDDVEDVFPSIREFTCTKDHKPLTIGYGADDKTTLHFTYNKDGSVSGILFSKLVKSSAGFYEDKPACDVSFKNGVVNSDPENRLIFSDVNGCTDVLMDDAAEDKMTVNDVMKASWVRTEEKQNADLFKEAGECCASASCYAKVAAQAKINKVDSDEKIQRDEISNSLEDSNSPM